MAEHTKYTFPSGEDARVPELLFLLDMVTSAPEKDEAENAKDNPRNYAEARNVYYDHRTFAPLVYFFLHSSPLYRELLLLDEEEVSRQES